MSEFASSRAPFEPGGDGALARMPGPARQRLLEIGHRDHYGPGTAILSEGADTPFLGVIERGRVALRLRIPERGERMTFVTVEPGELLGWSALVAPYRATADAVATEDTIVLAFRATELRELLERDHEVCAALVPIVLETVSRRLVSSWHQLMDTFSPRAYGPW
jgi:CRP-like cAMP-binding protein